MGNIQKEVDANLVELFAADILRKETLVKPKRADDGCVDLQFLPDFTQHGLFYGFSQLYPPAGEIVVGRALVVHGEDFALVDDYAAYPVVEAALFGFECNVHIRDLKNSFP